jgi:hypothetical protein
MRKFLAAAGIVALASCATAYQPQGFSGGFSEVPISADAYRISVDGNGFTNASRVNEMALLRGAELADQNGFRYFALLSMGEYTKQITTVAAGSSTTTTQGTATATGFGNSARAYGTSTSQTTYNAPQVTTIVKPGVDIVVRFVPDEYAAEASALSVDQIYDLYAEKYGLLVKVE